VRSSHSNPYAGYTIDDWNWEFLKRNQRYKRAYKAVQWLKARLDRKALNGPVCFIAFGIQFRFRRVDRGSGWEWCYQRNGKHPIYLNDLSSPDNPSSRRYKGKLIKKLKPVTQIDGSVDRHGNGWTPAILQDHEIAIQIDTRFKSKEILCSLKNILATIQPKKKLHVGKYEDYLTVWDLRQERKTLNVIAKNVWPDEYETSEKAAPDWDIGQKGYLIQRALEHEKAAEKLIEATFPAKKHRR
jgi:hypothetical protein